MRGREAQRVQDADVKPDKPAAARARAPADGSHAPFLTLARTVGNRRATRLLQRWRDENGKFHDGAKPPDAENWEEFSGKGGMLCWRRKASAPALTPTVGPTTTTAAAASTDPPRTSTAEWSLDPKKIRYSQDGIDATFSDGRRIDDVARQLIREPNKNAGLDAILITKRQGVYISLDNRRLWAFKHAGRATCPVKWATPEEVAASTHFDSPKGTAIVGVRNANNLSTKDLVLPDIPKNFVKKFDTYRYV